MVIYFCGNLKQSAKLKVVSPDDNQSYELTDLEKNEKNFVCLFVDLFVRASSQKR